MQNKGYIPVSLSRNGGANQAIAKYLSAVRSQLNMEIAYLGELVGEDIVFRSIDAPGLEHLASVGDRHLASAVYCKHILSGSLPRLIPNTSREPLCMELEITHLIPIGSHVGIPIYGSDGNVYGMFCCLSREPIEGIGPVDLKVAELFASLISDEIGHFISEQSSRAELSALIEEVIEKRAFSIVFQPIFDLSAMQVIGCEALSRFDMSVDASPAPWFQAARAVGLSEELEMAAFKAAVEAVRYLPDEFYVSVNLSPATILSVDVLAEIPAALHSRLVVEVAEEDKIKDDLAMAEALLPLRDVGLRIAIDDAGAGSAGIQRLVKLAPDIVKLDISLTKGIDMEIGKSAMAAAMVYFAAKTGAKVTAEGIETKAELCALQALGVHCGQGWFLGRPKPADTLTKTYSFEN
ncbi:sensor domain-containing phosphodiesterase [Palleronia abyssalis]|uniref:sensor domain-containing phosphodiesterase n=1 Tax=Palleronia abyssalis TaxID=1501240 RepID=UPI0011B29B7B|nr:EAL domain-containing protein [Palleronia abyssalis]